MSITKNVPYNLNINYVKELEKVYENFECEYNNCLKNKKFRKNENKSKIIWYKNNLRKRIFFHKYSFKTFDLIMKINDAIMPEYISKQIDRFCNVQEIKF